MSDNKILQAFGSRIEDLRSFLWPEAEDLKLKDDGTLDTVIEYGDREIRISQEDASEYRDEDGFDLEQWFDENEDEIRELGQEQFDEYALEFSYYDEGDDEPGFWRYIISTGGPQEEFRFYVDQNCKLIKAEFWYLDWFTGEHINVTHDTRVKDLWGVLREYSSCY